MKFLLGEIGKTKPHANVAAWLNNVDDADLAISALTVKEVRTGIVRLAAKKSDIAHQIEERVGDTFNAFGERIGLQNTGDKVLAKAAAGWEKEGEPRLYGVYHSHKTVMITTGQNKNPNRRAESQTSALIQVG